MRAKGWSIDAISITLVIFHCSKMSLQLSLDVLFELREGHVKFHPDRLGSVTENELKCFCIPLIL